MNETISAGENVVAVLKRVDKDGKKVITNKVGKWRKFYRAIKQEVLK